MNKIDFVNGNRPRQNKYIGRSGSPSVLKDA